MRSDAIRPGDVVGGKYRVRAILSRTRGFLVEAFHTEFDQRVVVRVLSPTLCDEKEVERFRREARTLAKLESEHVARILDVGALPDGAFFFARPYLEGTDLAAHLKKRGMLPLAEATLLILQACEAIAETHVHNIILRELQPSHLFLTQRMGGEPLLKVIDFGTAKLLRENAAPTAGGELTSTSMFGLSVYSSPELVRKAKHVDVRTDVWSLGAIFYQMLSGRPPFDGEMAMLMLQISRDDPPPLSRFRRDIPNEIGQIIGWAMAKDPDGRFASVHALAHALTPFASAEGKLLIERIGTIATAAKKRKKGAPSPGTMDPDHPETLDGDELLEDEGDDDGDAPTRIQDAEVLAEVRRSVGGKIPGLSAPTPMQPPGAQNQQLRTSLPAGRQPAPMPPPADAGESPFDRTVAISADFIPSSPMSPVAARSGSQPSPSVQLNMPQGAPPQGSPGAMFGGAAAGMPTRPGNSQPPPGLLGPSMQFGAPQQAGASEPPAHAGYGGAPRHAPTEVVPRRQLPSSGAISVKAPPKGAKAALIAVAGTAVALVAVMAFVLLRGGHNDAHAGSEASAQSAAASATVAPVAVNTASAAPSAAAPPTADPIAAAPPTTDPAAVPTPGAASAGSKVATGPGPAAPGPSSKSTAGSKATATATATAAPPPADSDAMGTLVAVAVGGTCSFSVNGASKGTMSKLKVQVKPGTYSVTCKPSTGATKSKSVTIASGGTAMAMFKLE